MAAVPPVSPQAELAAQVAAETKTGVMTASEVREIMAAQALLDARAAPSVIIEGEMGCGKTHSLRTLLMDKDGKFDGPPVSGIEFVLMMNHEGGFEDVLGDIPPTRLDWIHLPVSEGSFDALINMVKVINTQTNEMIAKTGGINRHMYPEFDKLLGCCNKFVGQRTGKDYGRVFDLPQNWCFWYESISALSEISRNNAVGDKPFLELLDYQKIQNPIMRFLNHLVFNTKCLFVATAHIERETNESNFQSELMISTVGKKLGPKLPRFFSDVILAERIDTLVGVQYTSSFVWHTVKPGFRTKTRNLPWAANLKPSFVPLLDNFRKRVAAGKKGAAANLINTTPIE